MPTCCIETVETVETPGCCFCCLDLFDFGGYSGYERKKSSESINLYFSESILFFFVGQSI